MEQQKLGTKLEFSKNILSFFWEIFGFSTKNLSVSRTGDYVFMAYQNKVWEKRGMSLKQSSKVPNFVVALGQQTNLGFKFNLTLSNSSKTSSKLTNPHRISSTSSNQPTSNQNPSQGHKLITYSSPQHLHIVVHSNRKNFIQFFFYWTSSSSNKSMMKKNKKLQLQFSFRMTLYINLDIKLLQNEWYSTMREMGKISFHKTQWYRFVTSSCSDACGLLCIWETVIQKNFCCYFSSLFF